MKNQQIVFFCWLYFGPFRPRFWAALRMSARRPWPEPWSHRTALGRASAASCSVVRRRAAPHGRSGGAALRASFGEGKQAKVVYW